MLVPCRDVGKRILYFCYQKTEVIIYFAGETMPKVLWKSGEKIFVIYYSRTLVANIIISVSSKLRPLDKIYYTRFESPLLLSNVLDAHHLKSIQFASK